MTVPNFGDIELGEPAPGDGDPLAFELHTLPPLSGFPGRLLRIRFYRRVLA